MTRNRGQNPLIIGHRGASGYRPEHTRSAYELALAMGADAVEPDVVLTKDGVLVVRHENEISTTTNVADIPEFADRKTTKVIDGVELTGWFTEDFTWDELSRLCCVERLPEVRPGSATFNGTDPILRLVDLLDLLDTTRAQTGRDIQLVLEVKHPTYFAGIGMDMAPVVAEALHDRGWGTGEKPICLECFEQGVLVDLLACGVTAACTFLIENSGTPADLSASMGAEAPTYDWYLTADGLDQVVALGFTGISVHKARLLRKNTIVADAHARGLAVFVWTLRPENQFLSAEFKGIGGRAAWGDYAGEWTRLLDTGVDALFTDQTDLLREVISGR